MANNASTAPMKSTLLPTPRWTSAAQWGGTDIYDSVQIAVGEAPRLTPLPLLPERGLGADVIARTAAMFPELPVDISPRAWRLADRAGRMARRAADYLERDLDAFEEAYARARGPRTEHTSAPSESPTAGIRLAVMGPWSLAARIELPGGRPVLSDHGARRDLAAAELEGVRRAAARLYERLEVPVRIVLAEPELWRVIAGNVPAPSEFDPVPAIPRERVGLSLSRFAAGLRGAGTPIDVVRAGGRSDMPDAGSEEPMPITEVLVHAPGRAQQGAPCLYSVFTEPGHGEIQIDGICVAAKDLLAFRGGSQPHGWADGARDPAAFALLDVLATVIDGGGRVELHGPHRLAGTATALPKDAAAAEETARQFVTLIDQLRLARPLALSRVDLTADRSDLELAGTPQVAALGSVRAIAEVLPRLAE